MSEEERLVEKLRRVEALFARPGTESERFAARAMLSAADVRDPWVS